MTRKARSHDVLGKFSAFSMAVVVLFSIFTPMLSGTTGVDAADASSTLGGSEMFTIHLDSAAASYWSNSMQVRFTDNSGATLATQKITAPAAGGTVTVNATGAVNATNIVVENLDTAKAVVKTQIDNLRDTANAANKVLFLYDNGNSKWSALKYYAYNSDAEAEWPGKDMSQIEGTDLWYASVDRSQYDKLIFNDGAGKQTPSANQTGYSVPESKSARYCYSSLQSSWVEYTDVLNSVTLSVANRAGNDKNHLYLTGEKTAAWSKYNGAPTGLMTIYFKPTANWSQASVTYDEDDPYSATVQMTINNNNGDPNIPLIFTAQVPVGAKLTFSDGGSHSVSNIIYNGNETLNTYIQSERQWDTLDKAMTSASTNVDHTVADNNFASAKPSGSGNKIVGVKATYFDYLSNNELTNGWRKNLIDGVNAGAEDYSTQFGKFNDYLKTQADDDTTWRYPLYFGNYYPDQVDLTKILKSYFPSDRQSNKVDYFLAANNANYLGGDTNRSVMGLVNSSLSGGNLMATAITPAPWFDNDFLKPPTEGGSTPQAEQIMWVGGQYNCYYKIRIPIGNNSGRFILNKGNDNDQIILSISDINDHIGGYYDTAQGWKSDAPDATDLGNDYNRDDWKISSDGTYYYLVVRESKSWGKLYFYTYYGYNGTTNYNNWPGKQIVDGTTEGGGSGSASGQYAKIIDSYFPFVATTDSSTGVTTYSFDSANATDNVYFTWNNNEPTRVNYGAGAQFGIKNRYSDGTYGIYPFNTPKGNGGVNETGHDFGFGIKMEMDFTLPANGVYGEDTPVEELKVTTTSLGSNYYQIAIPRKYDKIIINGSDHKTKDLTLETGINGKIISTNALNDGFTTVSGATYTSSYDNNYWYVVVRNNANWETVNAHFWKSDNNNIGTTWPGKKMNCDYTYDDPDTSGGGSQTNNHAMFNYTGDDDLWVFVDGQLVLDLGGNHSQTSGSIDFGYKPGQILAKSDKVYAILNGGSNGTDDSTIQDAVSKEIAFDNTDPSRKHTMTVFYMERGLNDSNLKVSYSIQPVQNELYVSNTVKVPEINSGIAADVMNAIRNSNFAYTLQHDSAAYAGKSYTLTAADKTTSNQTTGDNGGFTLKQDYSAKFTKDLKYGASTEVVETKPSVFDYTTSYKVTDNKTDTNLTDTTNDTTSNFNLVNKLGTNENGNEDDGASVSVAYTNTLKTSNLFLSKTLWQENGTTPSTMSDAFEFEVLLDLDGDGTAYSPKAYSLEYQYVDKDGNPTNNNVFTTDENGKIKLGGGQRVKFPNIPKGATYQITETPKSGFELYKVNGAVATSNVVTGAITGTDVAGVDGVDVSYENKEKPASARLQAQKTLDGGLYQGTDFSFTAKLIRRENGATIDDAVLKAMYATDGVSETTTVDGTGYITFADFNVIPKTDNVGKYVFKLTEAATEAASPYNYDNTVYYAVIEVTAGNVAKPVYYIDENCTQPYTVGASTDGKTAPTFKNTTKGVDIQFTKVDDSGNGLNGVEFKIYTDEACTQQYTTNAIGGTIGTGGTITSAKVGSTDGVVKVEKMAYSTTAPTTYYFKETKTLSGYQLLANPVVVTIATDGTYTVSYNGTALTDNKVTNNLQPALPLAGGVGVTMFYVLGALAVVIAGTAFILYKKRINVIALAAHLIHRK